MSEITWKIERISGKPINLPLEAGKRIFIVGANGTGKSALIHRFVQQHVSEGRIKWITAHRRTWLDSDGTNFTPKGRQDHDANKTSYDSQSQARWQDPFADANVSAALFDLIAKQSERAETITHYVDIGNSPRAEELASESPSPLDQINDLLELGRLKVSLEKAENQTLRARHENDKTFGIAEMSDGERSAMIIAAQVITAESGTVFLIDEPERHLHRSIIEPFLSALFELRRDDCTFVISTHEVMLPVANPDAKVLMLRSCQWNGDQCVAWDADVLEPDSEPPEELRLALLGGRRGILFVEGESTSLDCPFYSALIPEVSVVSQGSCVEVEKAVHGLRECLHLHHAEAFGLIDRDSRGTEEVVDLARKGVFAIDVYSVEGFYYCSEAIAAVARRQAGSLGRDAEELIRAARDKAVEKLQNQQFAERMAARRCERKMRERVFSKLPNWKLIKKGAIERTCVPIETGFSDEVKRYTESVGAQNLDELVARYPLRETGVFGEIAKALKCIDRWDYERMVVARIQDDKTFRDYMKDRLRPLVDELGTKEDAD